MRCPLVLSLAALIVLVGCTAPPQTDMAPGAAPPIESPEAGLWMVMERVERRLLTSGNVVRDEALQSYVREIACTLASDRCGDVRVYVVRRPDFNASMAPNGFMVIWTGALLRTENEAQIAAVIAHELAHYIRRHSLQQWEATKATADFAVVLSMATAMVGAAPIGALASLAAAGHLASYSRDQEREADTLGFELMHRAGYAPEEAPKIWSGLLAERKAADEDKRSAFLSSHPPSEERFQTLSSLVEETAADDDDPGVRYEDRYLAHVLPHRADWLEDEIDLRRFARIQVVLDRLRENGAGLGVIEYYQGELHRRRADPDDPAKAIAAYREALRHDDAPPAVHRGLGLTHWTEGDLDSARAAFERYLAEATEANDREMISSYLDELGDKT